jgi:hypothetical protein
MSIEIPCPSGLRFSARKLRVQELVDLGRAAESNAADGGLGAILSACWEELGEAGPAYPHLQHGSRPDFSRILDGDIVSALVKIRCATIGPMVEIQRVKCEYCGRPPSTPLEFSLEHWTDNPYPEATLNAVAAGSALEATMLNGEAVRFRSPILAHTANLLAAKKKWQRKLQEKGDPRAATALKAADWDPIVLRTTFVESIGDMTKQPVALIEWAAALELDEFYNLHDQYEAADGGMDTKVAYTCEYPNCDWKQERELPLAGEFFRPVRRRARTTEEDLQPS